MKNYTPLHSHSQLSKMDGLSKPARMKERIDELETVGCALTEHGSLSGCIPFLKAMEGKQAILGNELYISSQDAKIKDDTTRKMSHFPVLAKNDAGWRSLVKITSAANLPEHFYYKPRLSLDQLAEYLDGNIIGFSGHLGSDISNRIAPNNEISPDAVKEATNLAYWLQDKFGKGNFYLETQLMVADTNPIQKLVTEVVREVGRITGIPVIATPDAHYSYREDAKDQQILLCTNMNTTLAKAHHPDFPLRGFFKTDKFHIPSYQEMLSYGHTEQELENTLELASKCEGYKDILRPPSLPTFKCPDSKTPTEYLRYLCNEGMIRNRFDKKQNYTDRLQMELGVLEEVGLESYFLIKQDILRFCRDSGWLVGISRGSAGGCLVSYLIGVTQLDPIPYNLIFERFYNASRKGSMPDIDSDVPASKRDLVIDYIKNKYGQDKVSQMVSFQTIKGRGAVKSVFRAYGDVGFEEMGRITEHIPDEAKIADELQEMKEEEGESSILRWALENRASKLAEWCQLTDKGELVGQYADRFAQAMRLEGTKSAQSKHAAGIVIAAEPLAALCPMIYDSKTNSNIAGFEMNELEAIGIVKYDILGLSLLDKLMGISDILKDGDIKE